MLSGRSQSGFTLMEILVAVGLAGILFVIAGSLMVGAAEDDAAKNSRQAAAKHNTEILNLLRRDFMYRTASVITPDKKGLHITRRQFYESGKADQTYQVGFQSVCTKFPNSDLKPLLEKAYSGANVTIINKASKGCLKLMGCGISEYPQLKIDAESGSSGIPAYPLTEFPNFDGKNFSFGTAVCFDTVKDKTRVTVESVYIRNRKTGKISIKSDEMILSYPARNVEILPVGH